MALGTTGTPEESAAERGGESQGDQRWVCSSFFFGVGTPWLNDLPRKAKRTPPYILLLFILKTNTQMS